MVELFPERRRAELFARALDGHAAPTDARLRELLDTASALAAVPLVQPRTEFRDSLRARLMEAAAAELPAQALSNVATEPVPGRHVAGADEPRAARRRRRLVAVATGMVLIGGATGVAAASEQALPGDTLYPVKRTLESAEVGIAQGDSAEGHALLDNATTRLDEVKALSTDLTVDGSRPGDSALAGVDSALSDFAADASTGGNHLLQSYAASGDPAALRALLAFTTNSHQVLTGLSGTLPPQAQSSLSSADKVLVSLNDIARRACPDCAAAPPLQALPAAVTEGLPDVAPGGTPDIPAVTPDPPAHRQRTGGTHRARRSPKTQQPASGGLPVLPDLNLGGTDGQHPQQQGTSPGQGGGGSGTQQDPGLPLGEVLTPPKPQRTVDAPIPGRLPRDLGRVTHPLTDPLPSLLDGTGNTVGDTGDGLRGLL